MEDLAKIKKAEKIFVMITGKNHEWYTRISKREAVFLIEHCEGEFMVEYRESGVPMVKQAFIKPAE